MKHTQLAVLTLAVVVFVGCDAQKTTIERNKEVTQSEIDQRKDAVDVAAKQATRQADIDATIDKAKIEANKDVKQAQLDADKKKAEAKAEVEKAKVRPDKQ